MLSSKTKTASPEIAVQCGRIVYKSVVATLWLIVIVMALECYAVADRHISERLNRYIWAYMGCHELWAALDLEGQTRVVSVEQILPLILDCSYCGDRPAPVLTKNVLGDLFAQLNESERESYALLQSRIYIVSDRDATIDKAYVSEEAWEDLGLTGPPRVASVPLPLTPFADREGKIVGQIRCVYDSGLPMALVFDMTGPRGIVPCNAESFPLNDASGNTYAVVTAFIAVNAMEDYERFIRFEDYTPEPFWRVAPIEYNPYACLAPMMCLNNVGFRDDDVTLPKPAGEFRIACVGGSTTIEGLNDGLTYPNLVEAALNERFDGRLHVNVINCGISGMDTRGERKRLLDILRFQPDLVLEYNGINDLCNWQLAIWEEQAPPWRKFLRKSHFINRYLNRLLWPGADDMSDRLDERTFPNLRLMAEVALKHECHFAIASFAAPDPALMAREENVYYNWWLQSTFDGEYYNLETYLWLLTIYNQKVRALCSEKSLLYIPLAEEFHGTIREFGDACHLRPSGIQRKAEIIANYLAPFIERETGISAGPEPS